MTAALPPALDDALLEHRDLVRFQHRHAVAERLEVVQQQAVRETGRVGDRLDVHEPRHIRHPRDTVGHGAGDAEARALDLSRG